LKTNRVGTNVEKNLLTRKSRILFRPLLLLPGLTILTFVVLTGHNLIESRSKKKSSENFSSPQEISAEAIARYRTESRQLGSMRESARKDITIDGLLSVFRKPDPDKAYPELPVLLSDFQALKARSPEAATRVVREVAALWGEALKSKDASEKELSLLEGLFIQSELSIKEEFKFSKEERKSFIELLEKAMERGRLAGTGVLFLIQKGGAPEDASSLREIKSKAVYPQLVLEMDRVIRVLENRGKAGTADAGY